LWMLSLPMSLNLLVWFAVWTPDVVSHWYLISKPASRTLAYLETVLPTSAEVVTSQGFIGRFAGRQWVYPWWKLPVTQSEQLIPVNSSKVYAIVGPYTGSNVASIPLALSRIASLASSPDFKLISYNQNIWVFADYKAERGTNLYLPLNERALPAWALPSQEGRPEMRGPSSEWYEESGAKPGYVTSQLYARLSPGVHDASLRMSSKGPVNVEVWDADKNELLKRVVVRNVKQPTYISFKFSIPVNAITSPFSGFWFSKLSPAGMYQRDSIEIRVWTPGNTDTRVYTEGFS
uniref:hypothetical protein n=1 Tax=Alicyclobacillus sendaiensis TaxID=192387 RepID=UPI000B004616